MKFIVPVLITILAVFATCNKETTFETKLTPSDGTAKDHFGHSVAISGNGLTVAVGAPGVDAQGTNSGAVYIYTLNGGNWRETRIIPSDGTTNDGFGWSLDISHDGSTLAVGAIYGGPEAGEGGIYVFRRVSGNWVEEKLIPSQYPPDLDNEPSGFGWSVAVSADGSTIAAGAHGADDSGANSGSVYVFHWEPALTNWNETRLIVADGREEEYFGSSISLSYDGNTLISGAWGNSDRGLWTGAAYISKHTLYGWEETRLEASDGTTSDLFGGSVAISGNGRVAIVGAYCDSVNGMFSGSVYFYHWDGSEWVENKFTASDGREWMYLGRSVAISYDGSTAVVGTDNVHEGEEDQKAVYLYRNDGINWMEARIEPRENKGMDVFGMDVAISSNGNTIVVGAWGDEEVAFEAGAAYVFQLDRPEQ